MVDQNSHYNTIPEQSPEHKHRLHVPLPVKALPTCPSLSLGILQMEVIPMGEQTRWHKGDKAPNNGIYMEAGELAHHMGIEDPKIVQLEKGDRFPENTNGDRVWVLKRPGK